MDPQRSMYFTNLMQDGSNLANPSMMNFQDQMGPYLNQDAHVIAQASQVQTDVQSTSKKCQRSGNFTIEEDKLLVSAWLNISLDAVHENEQKHKTYWNRVWEYFHKYKNFESNRNENSLMNRWSTIQLAVNKFCGCCAQIESMYQSGVSEEDKICQAKVMFKELHKYIFQFEHCWNVLKYQPKWLEDHEKKKSKKRKTTASYPSTPEPINLGEDNVKDSQDDYVDLERPAGRKAEKERLNKQRNKVSTNPALMEMLNALKEERKQTNEKKIDIFEKAYIQEQERLEFEKRKVHIKQELLRVEQLKKEERIMMVDMNGLSSTQQEYYRLRQREILEQRGERLD